MSTDYLFPPVPTYSVPVVGESAEYPIHRIFCVGRNYSEHAKEMGVELDRQAPFYFTKPASALVHTGGTVPYPSGTENYHHEMELVLAIGKPTFRVSTDDAWDHIYGLACGLDMTRRDLQLALRAKSQPWDLGKAFEKAAIMAPIHKIDGKQDIDDWRLTLDVNGERRQDTPLRDLIWKVEEIVSHLSQYYHLDQGDLIYTGTPAGVGPVVSGDVLHGHIDNLTDIDLTIGAAE